MTIINLLIPFEKKDELKKQYSIKWNNEKKTWYYNGDKLPDELNKYTEKIVNIPYEDKDEYKKKYSSMKYNRNIKSWIMSLEDYENLTKK